MGIQQIQLTGGEVFLRRDLGNIIKLAHNLGLKITIITNASLISEELIDIIERYVSKIKITLYGFKKETYSHFSNDSSVLDKIIWAIDQFKKRNPSVIKLAFTITPNNYNEVTEFVDFAEERGLEYTIGKTLPIGLASKIRDALSAPHYNKFIEEFEEKYFKQIGIFFRWYPCKSDKITILSDGRVTICPLLRDPKFTIGNIRRQSLENIWYGEAIPLLKSLCVDNLRVCKTCILKYLCGGGCPAFWSIEDGYPSCKIYSSRKYLLQRCKI